MLRNEVAVAAGDPVKYSMVNPLLFVLAYQRVINPLAVV